MLKSLRTRPFLSFSLIGLVLVLLGLMFRNAPMHLLVTDDELPSKADYIVILMGNPIERAERAAELYQQGLAKVIIFAEAEYSSYVELGYARSNGQITARHLKKLGVELSAITFLKNTRNTSTKEEVDAIAQYFAETGIQLPKLVLVTSWYHSSRAAWITNKVAPESWQIVSAPSRQPDFWWHREQDFLNVFNEYLKWLYYLIKY